MKHLFFIHSHITFLVAKQYIADYHINSDDCLFMCFRNYIMPQPFADIYTDKLFYPQDIYHQTQYRVFSKNIVKAYQNIHILETAINRYFHNAPFLFYESRSDALDCISTIATMTSCQGFYILEEGTASYTPIENLPQLHKGAKEFIQTLLLQNILPRFFALRSSFYAFENRKYKGTIAISSNAFRQLPGERIIVSNPFLQQEITPKPDAVLSIDAALLRFFTPQVAEYVYSYIQQNCISKGQKIIAYKFHPDYYNAPDIQEQYRIILQKVFQGNLIELPSDVALENVLNTYNVDFYADFSSVAIYATIMGCKCYSYAHLLTEHFPNTAYQKMISSYPKMSYELYTFL